MMAGVMFYSGEDMIWRCDRRHIVIAMRQSILKAILIV